MLKGGLFLFWNLCLFSIPFFLVCVCVSLSLCVNFIYYILLNLNSVFHISILCGTLPWEGALASSFWEVIISGLFQPLQVLQTSCIHLELESIPPSRYSCFFPVDYCASQSVPVGYFGLFSLLHQIVCCFSLLPSTQMLIWCKTYYYDGLFLASCILVFIGVA